MGWLDQPDPQTALAPQPGRQIASSERLRPASAKQARDELTACLALVAPVGMTEEARGEWLAVAWHALSHLPADLLAQGCAKARATCDHPAKIVPAIIADTEDQMKWRREAGPSARPSPSEVPKEHRIESPMIAAEIDEMNAIMARIGAVTRYRPDGARYEVDSAAERKPPRGPLRNPTRQDYLDMGVDPASLESLTAS